MGERVAEGLLMMGFLFLADDFTLCLKATKGF